ncbi:MULTISPECIES: GNAT family N-acetyltransferase [Burkholderia]|uniref:GNAT family N-acetyltransferase n=1 Tax=Burkholderia sola TaxID=2843302 RepID=A0ABV2CG18_9BURK|nr:MULTISPECIES: GNAT family N-acetyltransferase [Burkholderia]KWU24244.1 GCN5 family acetyltransferase [Burkholderia cenocepacia]MBP0610075.1 GNAT family N-acetyltransferase [Burkholderia sp. CpTa8-5]OXI72006.1 N-acetyltransferase [Burkholderia sp. AU31280]QRR16275.1 GNAT family N-acetyltransferase [Burkholderia sp. MS389]QVN14149.1 GNAT family N-acetyltransferase [Burkholderia sp. LAS2]
MSIPWNAIAERTPAAPPSACADRVIVRRFDPAIDSYAQLTPMLHRAFARLGAMGLNCTCVDQDEDVTRRRAEAGECYVAVCGGRVVGTATLYATDPSSACSLYRREGVASVRQVAVDPTCQSRGIGALLLSFAEQWAALRGYALLALDTPHPASHLLAFYGAQGFEVVDVMRFAGKRYDSAILCKRPVARAARRVSPASRLAARVAAVRWIMHAWAPRVVATGRRESGLRRGGGFAARRAAGAASCRSSPWRPRQHGRFVARERRAGSDSRR